MEYKKVMDLVELWLLLNTRHCYNGWQLTQIHQQFPHVTSDVNEVDIITGLQSEYLGRKITKNQAEAMSIK